MKQPLGIVALLYLGGLLLGFFFQPPLPSLFALSLAVAAGALLLPKFRRFLIWPLIVLTGWTNFAWHTAVVSPTDLRVVLTEKPELATVRGTIAGTPRERVYSGARGESFHTMATLQVSAIERGTNWQPVSGQIVVTTPDQLPENFFDGREVQVYGVIGPPPLPLAEGLFDFRTYLRWEEIYFQLETKSAADWQLVSTADIAPPLPTRFAKWATNALALGRPGEDESLRLERTLTLGDKTFLTDEVVEPFVQAATYHIFAVDGLRMAIIFGIFFTALRALRVPRAVCGMVLIPLIWFYVALTGWPASAIRATIMLTIVIFGWVLRRPGDVFNSLYAAALIILVWQPQQLLQAGFQLSFFVVLCILLIMPILDGFAQRLLSTDPLLPEELRTRWQKILRRPLMILLGLVFTSLAAWIGSIPLVAYYFHIVTPVSTPANVIAVPLCGVVLASNLISLTLAGWLPAGAVVFNYIGWHVMEWIRVSSQWFANWPHAYSYVATPSFFTIIVYYLILLAVLTGWLFRANWRKWRIAALSLLLAAWCGQWIYGQTAARLTVIPLGGGSAIYCNPGIGKDDLLIDCGREGSVEFVLKPYLRAQGVNSLPRVALTHGDVRETGGFTKLWELLPIEKVVTSPVAFRSPGYRSAVQSLEGTPGRRQIVKSGDVFGNWTVLYPGGTNHFPQADDNALVLRGEFGGTRILLLSDLARPGQNALLESNVDLHADIVVAGLPETTEPLCDPLLDAIQPKLIIIADSETPASRRAKETLRTRLERHGIRTIYTRFAGAVKITMRNNRWEVNASREAIAPVPLVPANTDE